MTLDSRPLLIVTADDFALSEGICRAIIQAHTHGVVTATSVLAVGRAFDYGADLLRDTPGLAVGAHLALVGEDRPILTAAEIPTLVDRRGRFPLSYRTVVARAALGRVDPADVRREFAAQVAVIRAAALDVGHLDTHQHTHLWPSVAQVVVELAREHGIGVVRRPRSAQHGAIGRGVNTLSRRLDRRIAAAGLRTSDYYAGLDEAGSLDQAALSGALLRGADAGAHSVEVNTHPGEGSDPALARFAWAYAWQGELELLTAPGTADKIRRLGYRLARPSELLIGSGT
jgi:predicted glycoside hydrolase/deacetylase ChbG (UPF0249 family)